jgi:hypothetical protein
MKTIIVAGLFLLGAPAIGCEGLLPARGVSGDADGEWRLATLLRRSGRAGRSRICEPNRPFDRPKIAPPSSARVASSID